MQFEVPVTGALVLEMPATVAAAEGKMLLVALENKMLLRGRGRKACTNNNFSLILSSCSSNDGDKKFEITKFTAEWINLCEKICLETNAV